MGRTKGGLSTKIQAIVDEAGKPVRLLLTAGNEADISHAETLVQEIPCAMAVGNKGYDSDLFRQELAEREIRARIPPRFKRKAPCRYRELSYRKRPLVENFFERIKNFRRVATRYDKLAETFLGFVCLAATLVSLMT